MPWIACASSCICEPIGARADATALPMEAARSCSAEGPNAARADEPPNCCCCSCWGTAGTAAIGSSLPSNLGVSGAATSPPPPSPTSNPRSLTTSVGTALCRPALPVLRHATSVHPSPR
eukprot:14408199-Alexandrium_andersonii.AAC.1